MTIREDSYSSADEVTAVTRHLLDGESSFNSTTRPTGTELEKFIDRASSHLNVALTGAGLAAPVTNSTAKLMADDWVTWKAAQFVEVTQRGVGYSGDEGSRTSVFSDLSGDAIDFVKANKLALKRIGVGVTHKTSDGLQFTGLDDQDERDDPDDSDLEQPMFKRNLFSAYGNEADDGEYE